MTKERRIAIEMWEYIREQIAMDLFRIAIDLSPAQGCKTLHEVKIKWLSNNYPQLADKWYCTCWCCQYFRLKDEDEDPEKSLTDKCPLNSHEDELCDGRCTLYTKIASSHSLKEQRLEACDKIIEALKGGK